MTPLVELLQRHLDIGLAFLYPETCQLCHLERASARNGFICSRCSAEVRFIEPPFCERCGLPYPGDITAPFECSNCREMELHFTCARSAVVAHNAVREVIHRYKYQHAFWFEPFLTRLLLHKALPVLLRQDWHFIVPVPLHPVKQREREFNQAERLAARLSTATGIPLNSRLLRRQQRSANMRGAFAVRRGLGLDGERVVLVDDVFTTGATTSACAQILRAAGAGDVCVWTVARGL
jgi:competence protein ComFC